MSLRWRLPVLVRLAVNLISDIVADSGCTAAQNNTNSAKPVGSPTVFLQCEWFV
jgi:hypothetical protein